MDRTKLRHRATQKSQNQGPVLSQFFRKNTITFCPNLTVFWWKKGGGPRLKGRNQNETQPMLPTRLLASRIFKGFVSTICWPWPFRCQRSFFFLIFNHFFKFGFFFRYHTQFFWKNEFDFLVQNLMHRLVQFWNGNYKRPKSSCGNSFFPCFHFWPF